MMPPAALPASIRGDGGEVSSILQMSRTRLVVKTDNGTQVGQPWRGVLQAPGLEIPVSGTVAEATDGTIEVELDLLIAEYADAFEDYLTRAQLLDLVV